MSEPILYLDPDSPLNLQAQIRQKLVEAIHLEVFKPGTRLPSSRRLADQLGVARNTVVLACQQLVDEGLLTGRARSGLYVASRVPRPVAGPASRATRPAADGHWQRWLDQHAPIETPLSEFIKAGGSAKCLTLRLDGEEAAGWRQLQI